MGQLGANALKPTGLLMGLAAAVLLASCEKEENILQGEREGIRDVLSTAQARTEADTPPPPETPPPLALPAARANTDWPQRLGTPATRVAHPALGGNVAHAWSVNIGAGDGKRVRITADPVVAEGRIFTLDAQARVSGVSTDGELLWTADLVPPGERASDASGGGLAYGDGTLFVSSAFGLVTGLDATTGEILWQQDLGATGSGSPVVKGGLVYLVAGDEVAWALDTQTGRIEWRLSATPNVNNVLGGPAPAVTDKYVIFAFGTGEVQGAFRKGGLRLWDAYIAGERLGISHAKVADVTGDPVVQGDRVFVGTHAGRMVALGLADGERLWTAKEGPLNRVWPAGDSIFLVSDRNELLRLSAETGAELWARQMPVFTKDKPKRQTEIFAHHGPVIAGGQLIVASSDGQLRFFDPETGAPRGAVAMRGGATTNPVVAGQTLYVVTSDGQLHAFR